MQGYSAMKCLCAVTCIMIVVATVTSAAPSYADYDSKLIILVTFKKGRLSPWRERTTPANEIAQYLPNAGPNTHSAV